MKPLKEKPSPSGHAARTDTVFYSRYLRRSGLDTQRVTSWKDFGPLRIALHRKGSTGNLRVVCFQAASRSGVLGKNEVSHFRGWRGLGTEASRRAASFRLGFTSEITDEGPLAASFGPV